MDELRTILRKVLGKLLSKLSHECMTTVKCTHYSGLSRRSLIVTL